jgi:DeoR family transcriptional regulator of aga operon
MIQIARRVVLVGDSSKIGRRSLSVIAQINQIDQIITDAGANPAIVKALREHEVDVVLV